jgi:tetratricopeptide (TPR) repeat protein
MTRRLAGGVGAGRHRGRRGGDGLIALGLALAAALPFLGVLDHGFVWDDDFNLVENPSYRGLGPAQLHWMFTTPHLGHYIPLTWMTLGLDYLVWGMNSRGYHLTNLALHAANTALVYLVALRLLAAARPPAGAGVMWWRLGAVVVASLFAVHPLRVESVAWATERRDVLCALFYLLAVLAYLRACDAARGGSLPRQPWYWAALGGFALALLAKSMAVSLPLLLLALDIYPLRRLGAGPGRRPGPALRRVLGEKIPFALLSAAGSVAALLALHHVRGIIPVGTVSVLDRIAISLHALAFYLWKTLVPVHLSPLYERPERMDPFGWAYLLAAGVVLAATAAVAGLRRRWPALAAAGVAYVVMLLPVLGIVQNGPQLAADRYTYLPGLAWMLLAGGAVRVAGEAWQAARPGRLPAVALAGLASTAILAAGLLTWQQVRVWRDAEALWTHALAVAPSGIAHTNLGAVLARRGQLGQAMVHYREALRLTPSLGDAHYNLANALLAQGERAQAMVHYREALRLKPTAAAHYNLAGLLAEQGQAGPAIAHYREALRLRPGDADIHYNLAFTLAQQGVVPQAITHFRRALEIRPDFPEARENLDRLLRATGERPAR